MINWLLALSPILVVLYLMLGLRWGGVKAGPVGWLAALLASALFFGAGGELLLYAQLKSVFLTLFVLYIIWMALLFYHTVDEAGAVRVIGAGLPRLTADRALQALLLGWVFSAFLQGASGFGVPAAVVAPLMVGLGFPKVTALLIPSLGHAWAISFGSLGSSFYALVAATGRSGAELAPWGGIMVGLNCLICGAAVLWAAGGPRALRESLVPLLVIGLGMAGVQYVVVTNGFEALGGFSGGLTGLALSLLLFRLPRYQGSAAQRALAAQNAPPDSQEGVIPLRLALVPYALLILVVMGGQLVAPLKEFLGQVELNMHFPELSTSQGWVTPAATGRSINLLGHAGALLFYTTVFSYILLRRWGYYKPGAERRIARNTVRRATRSSIGIATMVAMAVIMEHAGMTRTLAEGVADAVGGAYPLASPFIGALGAFMTGSNTNSNVVFGSFQQDAANILGLDALIILASQTAGAALGSMFAPAKVIVAAGTVGLEGDESEALKKVMSYGLALVAVISLATWIAIGVWG
jgi:lactate permease